MIVNPNRLAGQVGPLRKAAGAFSRSTSARSQPPRAAQESILTRRLPANKTGFPSVEESTTSNLSPVISIGSS
ncbi:MAG TPA: hypothetical protein PLO92_02465 [Anaerolineaceae bacterium]|nr:hypothetical protein [Anaerolineaceae bacterium]HOR84573.1 hypothetical protein [Anaerolineaceae bacterium]HPL43383.1 hypothetical protein [Anaerolineaceae bacterium]HPY32558.1 hypothetical protein [Anaerolineaceae bacterium]HQC20677.1 hypothetical protein [Anaerolineaceae bacterium]